MNEPIITVGIINAEKIRIELIGEYFVPSLELFVMNKIVLYDTKNGILLETTLGTYYVSDNDIFKPYPPNNASFMVSSVSVGKNYHWERKEKHRYTGSFKIIRRP